jgi:uncharacterized protein
MTKNAISVIIFILLALGILIIASYFIFISLTIFFQLDNSWIKTVLATLLFVMPIIFILSSLTARYFERGITQFFYFLSGLWLGLGAMLFFFLIMAWLAYCLLLLAGFQARLSLTGGFTLILVFCFAAYGIWNTYHPRIKNISVKIKNLPLDWQGKKVIQISDLHLGHILQQSFLEKVIKQVNEQNPAAVFITGDLIDAIGDDLSYLPPALDSINAPMGMYFVTGNHETYFGLDKIYEILGKSKLRIFQDDMALVNGLQIIGINYPERFTIKKVGEIISNIPEYNPQVPSILLFHSPTQVRMAKKAGINLQLSGHTHRGQIFPLHFITWLIYRGHDYGLKTWENFSLYTTSGTGTWGPTMRTAAAPEIVVITLHPIN